MGIFESVGGLTLLGVHVLRWLQRSLILRQIRFGFPAAVVQMNRVGVRSIGIVSLVSGSIGIILALQTSPRKRPARGGGRCRRLRDDRARHQRQEFP